MNRELMGVFPLWKPAGMTSFTAVKEVGKRFGTKKAGHTGTLDPDVEGVLPVCIGRATKIVEYLTANDKTYIGEVTLGFSTTTEDSSGDMVNQLSVDRLISTEEASSVLTSLIGPLEQTPPMYSAVKVKGKKLYEYAREGIEVERPSRMITIYQLELLSDPRRNEDGTVSFSFRAVCSKGTYIRTLSVTIGEKLGFPAHMSHLIRESSGSFQRKDCLTLEKLDEAVEREEEEECLISIETALSMFPVLKVDENMEERILQGAILSIPEEVSNVDESVWALYNQQGECLALYKRDEKRAGKMKPEKMIRTIRS
ncbi:tRNA pseudouridine(55) synthase TruB [Salipaludibacillus keqinensis]|uniref:tRNA pseudouridine synthase B n=1 Tax=Salipaludibacillus keqinensis TaxID=2045207 RepID=A0A323TDA1_9BACI|nr:tRNA pseudouridine(55) synthase TruB [Salipaludibacillus keqinensis]PYZ93101.1 tRNA pseudouridine(55) synthase TruB [Salipaludibacillus keqinensis]